MRLKIVLVPGGECLHDFMGLKKEGTSAGAALPCKVDRSLACEDIKGFAELQPINHINPGNGTAMLCCDAAQ